MAAMKNLISKIYLQILIFILLSTFIFASCSSDKDCPQGKICDKGTCRDCLTSAECLRKTFLISTPVGGVSSWFVVSVIVLLIALLGVAIFYMIAYLFQSEQYKRIAFAELMQVLASFLLIAFLFGLEMFETDLLTRIESTSGAITSALILSSAGSPYTPAFSGAIQINAFDVSYAFLRNMLSCATNQLKTTYENSKSIMSVINTNFEINIQLSTKLRSSVPNPLSLLAGLSKYAAKFEYNATELTWLIIFLYSQIAVLKFFETSLFTVFLPIGLILRSFPPTRGAGAVLVAIAIGFYFVYPLTFVALLVGSPPVIEGCNIRPLLDVEKITKTCPLNLGTVSNSLVTAGDLAEMMDASIPKIQAGMTSLRFAAFFYMLISLGVTFIFVRFLSSLLGADISEIGRSMLRLL
ncbi:MAG: hypothetical protein NZ903_00985 [Candidatus Micrarchaeota archaeon]|nr:hypothetical protein [Candidatus Micrarchaeota archaeon]